MHLLKSEEFLNVGLFVECLVVMKGMLVCFYFKACCIFFPSLIYLFTFFLYEMEAFSKFIIVLFFLFFLEKKLLYFNGCSSNYCLMMECKMT